MLTWFPTPYPEEWWYGVLCRYYVRTGIKEHTQVKKMLFEGQYGAHMGTIFPNATLHQVVKQLPSELFDIRQILLEHTTFKYFTRLYQRQEQQNMLDWLCNGEVFQLSHLWRANRREAWAPRYCPACVTEDTEQYGEAYWHVDHQIPTMRVCPRHQCRLKQLNISPPYPTLYQRFFPLAAVEKDMSIDKDYPDYEDEISRHVRAYLKMPMSVGPTKGHNNLVQALKNRGYYVVERQQREAYLDKERIYSDMVALFGSERVELAFNKRLTSDMALRIERWEYVMPDRFILLQTLIGLPTETVFDENPVQDDLRLMLEKAAAEGRFETHGEAAKRLGLKRYQLNSLVYRYGMEPFWLVPLKGKRPEDRRAHISFTLDKAEKEEIEEFSKSRGYRCVGNIAMHCIQYVMKQERERAKTEMAVESDHLIGR